MSVTSRIHLAGYPTFNLSHGDNEVEVSAFGGQIVSWTRAGEPIVFDNSADAISNGRTPYRGGAPICFSFFGKGSLLPLGTTLDGQHGAARTAIWDAQIVESENAIILSTTQPSAPGYGPTQFSCELVYTLQEGLNIRATIRNVGENPSPFQFVIHTYWATKAPSSATVIGLGNRYLDNLMGLTEQSEEDSSVPHPTPYDRVYLDSTHRQDLTLDQHIIEIVTEGCAGAVLWNPGPNHTIQDLGSPDFVCLESGLVTPSKTLSPGEEHMIKIFYSALPA